ncbi:MAG: iron-sulfur cluster repair di-iron protein [Bacteroidota bacterium]
MRVLDKTIKSVVDENYVYARALHYLGIEFFENEHKSLNEICKERGISRQKVIKCFYEIDANRKSSFQELSSYPIEMLLEYLRHSHYLFIKEKLPYISFLLECHDEPSAQDLKAIFPVFVEDFIKHIYEEEDEVFKYVALLNRIESDREANPSAALLPFWKFSLAQSKEEHDQEDAMGNLTELTDSVDTRDLRSRVIIKELKAFEREVSYHAEIENEIMFPKALKLESDIQSKLRRLRRLN